MSNSPVVLRFGIPSLDEFFTTNTKGVNGIEIPPGSMDAAGTTSLCIIGADGAGKSVIAMHMAAYYAADAATQTTESKAETILAAAVRPAKGAPPKPLKKPKRRAGDDVAASEAARVESLPSVLYASTDLRHSKAEGIWQNFGLQWPGRRASALHQAFYDDQPAPARPDLVPVDRYDEELEIKLLQHLPLQPNAPAAGSLSGRSLASVIAQAADADPAVDFVDLAATTAGDDWSYINRLLALLPPRRNGQAAHLLIIDAVEGLETLVGEFDAYGERRSRRSRISQVMRNAEGKCHVVFVVEEPRRDEKHPEEFVTDAVLRMRTEQVVATNHTFTRRTLEVEKARGQQTVRGRHAFHIADGKGTFTRNAKDVDRRDLNKIDLTEYQNDPNPDDPPVIITRPDGTRSYLAYFQVLHSLSYWNRRILEERSTGHSGSPVSVQATNPAGEQFHGGGNSVAAFGIDHLDDMLDQLETKLATQTDRRTADGARVIAIKPHRRSETTRSHDSPNETSDLDLEGLRFGTITALVGENDTLKSKLIRAFLGGAMKHRHQVALLVGLDDSDFGKLDADLSKLTSFPVAHIHTRLVRRRLVGHYSSSAALFKIISRSIGKAKQKLRKLMSLTADDIVTWELCGNVRMVISNLTTMREVFPDVQGDPLFLPTLIEYLEHQGVTALVVAAEPGGPNSGRQSEFCRELRGLVHQHICTWHVPFFGEDRVAIAVIPPIRHNQGAVVRELKRCDDDRDKLEVNPHFEMYTGLHEQTVPQLVPMRACLIGQGKGFEQYMADIEKLIPQVFPGSSVINVARSTWSSEYEMLRAYSFLQGDTRLDHTLVMQIDEFWAGVSGSRRQLADLTSYLHRYDVTKSYNDPFQLFFQTAATAQMAGKEDGLNTRKWYFRPDSLQGANLQDENWSREPSAGEIWDRVPMHWDFGFAMLREFVWRRAMNEESVVAYRTPVHGSKHGEPNMVRIGDILAKLYFGARRGNRLRSDLRTDEELKNDSKAYQDLMADPNAYSSSRLEKMRQYGPFDGLHLPFLTWREFFQACVKVSRNEAGTAPVQPYAFDVEALGSETLCCWILEIWATEIEISKRKAGWRPSAEISKLAFFEKASGLERRNNGLRDLLEYYSEELFRVYLLLGEVVSARQFGFEHTEFMPRHSHSDAIATRHWYSTACPLIQERPVEDPLIAAPLPGCFTTRGDWYLAIAHGSRSMQTGYRALDLLCSRRANVTRLQNGTGLPVRDFKSAAGKTWTRLFRVDSMGNREYLKYDRVESLGTGVPSGFRSPRQWLWRSGIHDYHRHERYFPKIVGRAWGAWPEILAKGFDGSANFELKRPRNGFEIYDRLMDAGRANLGKTAAFQHFKKDFVQEWIHGVRDSVKD